MVFSCLRAKVSAAGEGKVKVVLWGGETRILLAGERPAGELLVEFPDQLVCHAGSFFIGRPVPSLSIGDELLAGETYFVIPADRLPFPVLTAGAIASLRAAAASDGEKNKARTINFGGRTPFEITTDAGRGDTLIKVSPEFMEMVMGGGREETAGGGEESRCTDLICSTPELRKHYEQLVGRRTPPWSPKLDTISEKKKMKRLKFSPALSSSIARMLSPLRLRLSVERRL